MQLICQALKVLIYRKISLNQPIKPAVTHQIRATFNENAYMQGVHRLPPFNYYQLRASNHLPMAGGTVFCALPLT